MGDEAVEISNLILEAVRPFAARLCALGVLQKIDVQMLSPFNLLDSRDKFRQEPPVDLPHMKYGEIEGYFGVLITLNYVRKLLASHGIRPAFEMLEEKLKQGSFARFMSRNEAILKAKLLMQKTISNGAPSPKLAKMLDVLTDHFKVNDSQSSRVIIFSNYRGSVRDIMSALENIGEFVKAMEFIGQSSGKTLKGQPQKVQQAVLKKFRTGGYNVLVATSIGEEGLDIMEVDLVVCFDANISPLRMIQRMGRTGRKHEGRVVVLACEGSELKGYVRKKANSKSINKHMQNGGLSSFNFHSSPRMVPHCIRPEVQFLKMSIEQFVPRGTKTKDDCLTFVPRGKKTKDDSPVSVPAYKTKLVEAEMDLLAKYFPTAIEVARKPSLVAFPHFQAFPSPVNEVIHSSRTCMLIDTMQCLQGRSFSKENRTIFTKDEDISYPSLSVEAVESHKGIIKGRVKEQTYLERNPAEGHLKTVENDTELEETTRTREMHIEDLDKQKPCGHTEFISVDDPGNVLVLSLPRFPLQSHLKSINSIGVSSVNKLMGNSENREENMQAKDNLSPRSRSLRGTSRKSKEMDISGEAHKVVYSMIPVVEAESSNEFRDSDLSPRLTNFIKSGIVPESPLSKWNCDDGSSMVAALVSTPQVQAQISMNSRRDEEKETNVPCLSEGVIQTPALYLGKNAPSACKSPVPGAKEVQMPYDKSSNSSSSKDWLVESETVEQHHKLRRLRKHGDPSRKVPPESKDQVVAGVHTKIKPVKGKRKQAKNVVVYIHDEAEVSSEVSVSEDEEDEQINSSFEDSFIDDGVNPTLADSQTGVSRTDMMAIYRRSLLSQSPFQRIPNISTDFGPDSMVQCSTMNETGSSSGTNHNKTTQTGLESTAKNSQFDSTEIDNECRSDGRKRKLSFFQAQSIPMVNLDDKFSLLSAATAKTSSPLLEMQNTGEKREVFEDDDQFYEGIDLDAVEEEASKLLRDCCARNIAMTNEAIPLNLGIHGSPSFDLGV